MRKLIVAVSAITFFVTVFAICAEQAPLSANLREAPKDALSIPGNWSLACLPTVKPQPVVDAYSVTTDASKGLTITHVGVRNESRREVVAVKLGWRLFLKADPHTNLQEGETPLLGIPLSAGERRVVEFPVVTASRVLGTMLGTENSMGSSE